MKFLTQIIIIGFGLIDLFIINIVDQKTAIFLIILGGVAIPFELLMDYFIWGWGVNKKPTLGDVNHD